MNIMETEEKYFAWFDSGRGITYGPHYWSEVEKAPYHSLDDILNTHLSETVQKRLNSLKMGNTIKAHRLHSAGDMMLKRITLEQKKELDRMIKLQKKKEELIKEMYELETEIDFIAEGIIPKGQLWGI